MAEGLAKEILGKGYTIESAGSTPKKVNPFAVQALKEIGIDISKNYSKSTDDLSPRFLVRIDYVITLCAEEVCPVLISKAKKLHWPFPDPAGTGTSDEQLKRFRDVRDKIKERLATFKEKLPNGN
jgi:arsenate reductase